MQIRSTIDMLGGDFHATLAVEGFTASEQENLNRRGPFLVDFGGLFTAPPGGVSFTLNTNERQVPDELPVKQIFSTVDLTYNVARDQVALFVSTMETRLHTALSNWLLPNPVGSLSDRVVTLSGNIPSENVSESNEDLAAYMNL